jgi:hypothetical protein
MMQRLCNSLHLLKPIRSCRPILIRCLGCLILIFAFVSCSPTQQLPNEVEKLAQEEAMRLITTPKTWELYLDEVHELAFTEIRSISSNPDKIQLPAIEEMWCFTTHARGKVQSISQEVSVEWFAIKKEGEREWIITPRHIVSYPAIWDDACDW